jgi:hypothetical protein
MVEKLKIFVVYTLQENTFIFKDIETFEKLLLVSL